LGIFATRFLIEFVKNVQEAFEEGMLLNMGQLLSLPFILLGAWLVMRALKRPQEKSQSPTQKERVQVRL
jgi:prolipoprotein diacylglyceryltransferase